MHRMQRSRLFARLSRPVRKALQRHPLSCSERDRQGEQFSINVKPTVTQEFSINARARRLGDRKRCELLSLQPMDRWTPETYDELWIRMQSLRNLSWSWDGLSKCHEAVLRFSHHRIFSTFSRQFPWQESARGGYVPVVFAFAISLLGRTVKPEFSSTIHLLENP